MPKRTQGVSFAQLLVFLFFSNKGLMRIPVGLGFRFNNIRVILLSDFGHDD